jgi:uncharacterized cofD-like protein
LEPDDASAFPPVIQAILHADLIIIGPGSLYTSLLPNLLVHDLLEAIRTSKALCVYVTNIVTQPGETETYTCEEHITALESLIGSDIVDMVVCNSCYDGKLPADSLWVRYDGDTDMESRIYAADLIAADRPGHHDANKLSRVLVDLYLERTGPLSKETTTQAR